MRRKSRLLVSVFCGVAAVLLALAYAESARAEVRQERSEVLERYGGEVTQLVVAKKQLSAGAIVTETDVELREWLSDLAPTGAITNQASIIGMRLTSSVAQGEPLNELDVAATEGAIEIPEGRVAISVQVSSKTGYVASAGNSSRVLVYRATDNGLRLIGQDVLVLTPVNNAGSSSSDDNLCLAVFPAQVEDVLTAASDGSLRLAVPGEGVNNTETQAPDVVEPIDEEKTDE